MGIPDFESSAFGHSANLPNEHCYDRSFSIASAKVIIISEIMKRYAIFFYYMPSLWPEYKFIVSHKPVIPSSRLAEVDESLIAVLRLIETTLIRQSDNIPIVRNHQILIVVISEFQKYNSLISPVFMVVCHPIPRQEPVVCKPSVYVDISILNLRTLHLEMH